FFFQAEDGIRDLIVTGVQTCALPIYLLDRGRPGRRLDLADQQEVLGRGALVELGLKAVVGGARDPGSIAAEAARRIAAGGDDGEIGRASCRERGEVWGGAGAVKNTVR